MYFNGVYSKKTSPSSLFSSSEVHSLAAAKTLAGADEPRATQYPRPSSTDQEAIRKQWSELFPQDSL